MREIKFRGYDKIFEEWVYGYYVKTYSGHKIVCPDPNTSRFTEKYVVGDSVGEFTGMYDSKGKPIYEGDILAFYSKDKESSVKTYDVSYNRDYWEAGNKPLFQLLKEVKPLVILTNSYEASLWGQEENSIEL